MNRFKKIPVVLDAEDEDHPALAGSVSRFLILFSFLAVFSSFAPAEQKDGYTKLEKSLCGLKEPFIFWLWSSLAGSPNADRLAGLNNVEDISFETKDNRILRGYRLKATGGEGQEVPSKGYLLVLQGNAILADQIINDFTHFSSAGFDIYIYDFRGYGRSEGKRRLKAIVSDYAEIIAALNSANYDKRFVYAMSFGGIAFLDGFELHGKLDRIVVDSTPSHLSDYGCPPEYDPVYHLPEDCSQFLFIVGQNDRVVPPSMSQRLVETAQQRSATILRDEEFGHPFMDYNWSVHRRRMKVIEKYLLYNENP
ncbi:MAG TPA: alpha/beta fold hydrolase [Gammaproteobacteria bacterium]|nr:alpha/beta fold hydrolase [Gammaproteobacteria bacterium]